MPIVQIDGWKINDWTSFHSTCREVFGFPSFYGMNLNAFIDCLSYIDEDDGMSNIILKPDEHLTIELLESKDFQLRVPEVFDGLIDSIQAINQRFIDDGKQERISLALH